jgi:hypothetical protein
MYDGPVSCYPTSIIWHYQSQSLSGLWWGFCSQSLAGIAGSNPTGSMDVCLFWVLCVIKYRSLQLANPLSRGVLPNVVCLTEYDYRNCKLEEAYTHKGCWAMKNNHTTVYTMCLNKHPLQLAAVQIHTWQALSHPLSIWMWYLMSFRTVLFYQICIHALLNRS